MGGGYLLGYVWVASLPALPPAESKEWVFLVAAGALAIGLIECLAQLPAAARHALRLAAAVATVRVLLGPAWTNQEWTTGEAWRRIALWGAGIYVAWSGLDRAAARRPGAVAPLVVFLVAAAGLVALERGKTISVGRLAGAVAATAAAALVVAWIRPKQTLARGAAPAIALVLPALWLVGYHYAYLPRTSAILLTAAPCATWVALLPGVRGRSPRQSASAAAIVALGLAAAAVWLSHTANPALDAYTPY